MEGLARWTQSTLHSDYRIDKSSKVIHVMPTRHASSGMR
jgi:hypothetical protein